jgi:hypothetical protein
LYFPQKLKPSASRPGVRSNHCSIKSASGGSVSDFSIAVIASGSFPKAHEYFWLYFTRCS